MSNEDWFPAWNKTLFFFYLFNLTVQCTQNQTGDKRVGTKKKL